MNTPRTIINVVVAWLSITALFSETSKSYTYYKCKNNDKIIKWPDKKINWHAGKNSFKTTEWRDHLLKANNRWNQAPGDFTFGVQTWHDGDLWRGNQQNEIWFSSKQRILDGAPATCYRWAKCTGTVRWREKDIIFDSDLKWSRSNNMYSKTTYGGDWRIWGATALHEMGHALGLAHENDVYNIMGTSQTHVMVNDGKVRFYAGEDGGNGEVYLYGKTATSPKNDLGVTHWKYGGEDGEYSRHWFCRIYHTDNSKVDWVGWRGVRRYKVKLGGTYKAQFTYENNGYYNQTGIDVAFYISTNSNITTKDERIRTATMNLSRDKAWRTKHTVTIPNSSEYEVGDEIYLGVIVDYKDKISEFSNFNNATYLPILIVN